MGLTSGFNNLSFIGHNKFKIIDINQASLYTLQSVNMLALHLIIAGSSILVFVCH